LLHSKTLQKHDIKVCSTGKRGARADLLEYAPLETIGVTRLDFLLQHLGLVALVIASALLLAWPEIQGFMGQQNAVSTLEATHLINQKHAIIIDLRRVQDYEAGHLPQARHIPADELASRVGEVARFHGRPAILVATGAGGNAGAVNTLKAQGFTDIFTLKGGVVAWVEASLPIERSTIKA
jgi:rhodanese-related sulfurtransferase